MGEGESKQPKIPESEIEKKQGETLEMDKRARKMKEKGEAKTEQEAVEKMEWMKVVKDKIINITEPGTLFHFTDYKYFDSIWQNGIKEGSAISLGPTTWGGGKKNITIDNVHQEWALGYSLAEGFEKDAKEFIEEADIKWNSEMIRKILEHDILKEYISGKERHFLKVVARLYQDKEITDFEILKRLNFINFCLVKRCEEGGFKTSNRDSDIPSSSFMAGVETEFYKYCKEESVQFNQANFQKFALEKLNEYKKRS